MPHVEQTQNNTLNTLKINVELRHFSMWRIYHWELHYLWHCIPGCATMLWSTFYKQIPNLYSFIFLNKNLSMLRSPLCFVKIWSEIDAVVCLCKWTLNCFNFIYVYLLNENFQNKLGSSHYIDCQFNFWHLDILHFKLILMNVPEEFLFECNLSYLFPLFK